MFLSIFLQLIENGSVFSLIHVMGFVHTRISCLLTITTLPPLFPITLLQSYQQDFLDLAFGICLSLLIDLMRAHPMLLSLAFPF